MILSSKVLIGLPVKTKSGTPVGKACGFELEAETGQMKSLQVKAPGLVPGLLNQELSVAWTQIIEITDKQVTVEDAVVPAGARRLAVASEAVGGVSVQMSERGVEGSGATET